MGRAPRNFYATKEGQEYLKRLENPDTREATVTELAKKFGTQPDSIMGTYYRLRDQGRIPGTSRRATLGGGTLAQAIDVAIDEIRGLRARVAKLEAERDEAYQLLDKLEKAVQGDRIKRAGIVHGT